ncbi:MAG: stalk domain-containing protein [Defluviitaleaceae bacterium]|nr:stalk domain-containing protein [Defluviitaleaceae bacterium]
MRFTRKLLAVVLVFALVFALLPITAMASDAITVTIDGEDVEFEDQAPIMVGGRVLIPVRFVFGDLGFVPDWNRSTRTATLTSDDYEIVIVIGEYEFTVNGEVHELVVPAQLIGGRTMLPMGSILMSIGIVPGWDGSTRTVTIETSLEARTRRAAEAGDADAQHLLGHIYRWGIEPRDDERVVYWYQRAVLQGHIYAHVALGLFVQHGVAVEQSYVEAVRLYRVAAEAGYAQGQVRLGSMYFNGLGVEQDYEEALYWFLLAFEQRSNEADEYLEQLYEMGILAEIPVLESLIYLHLGVEYTILPEEFYYDYSLEWDDWPYITTWQFLELDGEVNLDDFEPYLPHGDINHYEIAVDAGTAFLLTWHSNNETWLFIYLGGGEFHAHQIS